MHKKMFMGGLALMLVLGMAFQAVPTLAQGVSGNDPLPWLADPVEITRVVLLPTYPPQIRITGSLPSSCYQVRVTRPQVGRQNPATSVTPITIRVLGVLVPDQPVCNLALKQFTRTVRLDPLRLGLAPGRYKVMVNPVSGKSAFKVFLTLPRVIPVY